MSRRASVRADVQKHFLYQAASGGEGVEFHDEELFARVGSAPSTLTMHDKAERF
jgi:hypothetical protein